MMLDQTRDMRATSLHDLIIAKIQDVARQQSVSLAPLTNQLPLMESGLDSLCIAVIVAGLDDELGLDPFSGAEDVEFPVTIGDFIKLYENASR